MRVCAWGWWFRDRFFFLRFLSCQHRGSCFRGCCYRGSCFWGCWFRDGEYQGWFCRWCRFLSCHVRFLSCQHRGSCFRGCCYRGSCFWGCWFRDGEYQGWFCRWCSWCMLFSLGPRFICLITVKCYPLKIKSYLFTHLLSCEGYLIERTLFLGPVHTLA